MSSSGLKNLWKALKPPPPVPRRPQQDGPQRISLLHRMWNAVKPPPPLHETARVLTPAQRRRRRLIWSLSTAVFLLASGGWALYRYITSAPQRASVMLQEGMRSAAAGNEADAVKRFTRAVEIWPSMTTAYFERGLAHQTLNEQDLALADFVKVVDADPNMGAAHTALGSIYRQRGDMQRAENEFTVAINLNGDLDAYYQRGQVYESRGEHQKAISDFDVAISQLRGAPYVYLARAAAREGMGDKDGAEEDRKTSVQLQNHGDPSQNPDR
jgi:tetratricopeptide (TPR) repeat protein